MVLWPVNTVKFSGSMSSLAFGSSWFDFPRLANFLLGRGTAGILTDFFMITAVDNFCELVP